MSATRAARRHELLAHTADVGFRAEAPDLPGLFEEAALALAGIAADVDARRDADRDAPSLSPLVERIRVEAADPAALAFAWLNELVGLADARRCALLDAHVEAIRGAALTDGPAAAGSRPEAAWKLDGIARFAPFGPSVRGRLGVKSATYHALEVAPISGGWSLTAYLDV